MNNFDLLSKIREAAARPMCGLYPSQTENEYVLRWRANLGLDARLRECDELYRTSDFNEFLKVVQMARREFADARKPRRRRAA